MIERGSTVRTVVRAALAATTIFLGACAASVDLESDTAQLLASHERVLEAHRNGDVGAWMDVEEDPYISANRGTITFPTAAERRAGREPYLNSTTFTAYRDLQAPVVRLSADGTLGWLIAQVEMRGTQVAEDGTEAPVEAIWAWIELYQKQDGAWRQIGNVSNRQP